MIDLNQFKPYSKFLYKEKTQVTDFIGFESLCQFGKEPRKPRPKDMTFVTSVENEVLFFDKYLNVTTRMSKEKFSQQRVLRCKHELIFLNYEGTVPRVIVVSPFNSYRTGLIGIIKFVNSYIKDFNFKTNTSTCVLIDKSKFKQISQNLHRHISIESNYQIIEPSYLTDL